MEQFKRSLFDVVQENFKVAGRRHHLHRIVYAGEHKYQELHGDGLTDFIENNMKTQHDDTDEVLVGFLLVYSSHFVHILEGNEDGLMKHLSALCNDDVNLGRLKLLLITYHINQRYFSKWESAYCRPPVLLEHIDPESSQDVTDCQTKVCLRKLFRLVVGIRRQPSLINQLTEQCVTFLPECEVLDFLIRSKSTRDLRVWASYYRSMPPAPRYDELVWPATCEFVPTDVLSTLPTPKPPSPDGQEEEEVLDEEEDKEDQRSEISYNLPTNKGPASKSENPQTEAETEKEEHSQSV